MSTTNKGDGIIGASLFVASSTAQDLYEVLLDVRSFPGWAPGVRRVEILARPGEPGMISEWEISAFGLKRKILSVLEEAEPPALLHWTYDGLIQGWGRCDMRDRADGAFAEFRTELYPTEPILGKLMRMPAARSATSGHLKRCLARLGRVVSEDGALVRVGPPESLE